MDSDLKQIAAAGEKDMSKDKARFSSSPSGLSEEQKNQIKDDLNKIIARINLNDASTLNSDEISEDDLMRFKKAGHTMRKLKIKKD